MKISKSLENFTFKYFYFTNNKINSDKINISGISTDHIFNNIKRKKNFYEHDLLFHLYTVINPKNSTIIDIGANIGNHSIYFGKYLCDKIIAIEPSQMHSDILRKNLSNNLSEYQYEILQIAVGNEEGYANLVFPSDINLGAAKIDSTSSNSSLNSEKVPIKKLDNVINDLNISMLKIDVEGFEIDVLRGAENLIKNNLPHIIVEAHDDEHLNKIKKFLNKYEYTILGRFCYTPTYHFINKSKYSKDRLSIFSKIMYQLVLLRNKLNKHL